MSLLVRMKELVQRRLALLPTFLLVRFVLVFRKERRPPVFLPFLAIFPLSSVCFSLTIAFFLSIPVSSTVMIRIPMRVLAALPVHTILKAIEEAFTCSSVLAFPYSRRVDILQG